MSYLRLTNFIILFCFACSNILQAGVSPNPDLSSLSPSSKLSEVSQALRRRTYKGFTRSLVERHYKGDFNYEKDKGLLENALRELNLIQEDEKFIDYKEVQDWRRGGGETYFAVGEVTVQQNDGKPFKRKFVGKAIIKMFPEHVLPLWEKRFAQLTEFGIRTPKNYAYRKGTIYQEYLPNTAEGVIKKAKGTERQKLLEQLADIAAKLDFYGFEILCLLSNIMSDGVNLYVVDVGSDLGDTKGIKERNEKALEQVAYELEKSRMAKSAVVFFRTAYTKRKEKLVGEYYPLRVNGFRFSREEMTEIEKLRNLVKDKLILIVGPPASGKGFIGARLASLLGMTHISYGDVVRKAAQKEDDAGLKRMVQEASDRGELLPDEVAVKILKETLASVRGGIILDGFPRRVSQARALQSELPVALVMGLKISEQVLYDRIESRVVCSNCGKVYSKMFTRPDNEDFLCDNCRSGLIRRTAPDGTATDTEEILRKRLIVYKNETSPLIDFYTGLGLYVEVDNTTDGKEPPPSFFLQTVYDETTGARKVYKLADDTKVLSGDGLIREILRAVKSLKDKEAKRILEGIEFTEGEYEDIIKLRKHVKDKRIIFVGPPASGKGFVGRHLAGILELTHISFGDVVREIGRTTTNERLRKAIQESSSRGTLLQDSDAIEILKEKLESVQGGVILEGFPRTVSQAEALQRILPIDFVIALDIPDELLYDRVESRVVCEKCGRTYSSKFVKHGTKITTCDHCGGKLTKRTAPDGADTDTREILQRRLELYQTETQPLIAYYRSREILATIANVADSDEQVPEGWLQYAYDPEKDTWVAYKLRDGRRILDIEGVMRRMLSALSGLEEQKLEVDLSV